MYTNSLAPSRLFAIVLLLFSAAGLLIWLGFLLAPEEAAFDLGGSIVLGLALLALVLSILFWTRVRWARVLTSILLHLFALILAGSLVYAIATNLTLLDRIAVIALMLVIIGLLLMGILILHSDAMRLDMRSASVPQEIKRPRRRRWIPAGVAGVLVLLGAGAWRVVPVLWAKPTIAVDYLTEANELSKPADYDPNRNAALRYEKLFTQFAPLPEILKDKWDAWPTELILNEYEALKAWAPINEPLLPELAEAAKCPYWWYELRSDNGALSGIQTYDLGPVRNSAMGVALLAKYKASRGDPDPAMRLLADLHMMGIHRIEGATLVDQLIGVAVCGIACNAMFAILRHCPLEKNALAEVLSSLAPRLSRIKVPQLSETERLYGYDRIQRSFTDDGDGSGRLIPGQLYDYKNHQTSHSDPITYLDAIRVCLAHPSRAQTENLFTTYFVVVQDLAESSPGELDAQDASYESVLSTLLSGNYLLRDGFESMARCIQIGWRAKAHAEGLMTVLSILIYKAREGRLPESLDQLVEARLLKEVPRDPYSDGALVYKVTGNDFMLYSVGEDFTDDEGLYLGKNDGTVGDYIFWPVPDETDNHKTTNVETE